MPTLNIETNINKSKVPKGFAARAGALIAKILDKPEALCYVSVVPDVITSFGGTDAPAGFAVLMSIGGQGVEENKKYSKELCPFIERELGIPPERFYIHYIDEKSYNVGYKNTTYHQILGK